MPPPRCRVPAARPAEARKGSSARMRRRVAGSGQGDISLAGQCRERVREATIVLDAPNGAWFAASKSTSSCRAANIEDAGTYPKRLRGQSFHRDRAGYVQLPSWQGHQTKDQRNNMDLSVETL